MTSSPLISIERILSAAFERQVLRAYSGLPDRSTYAERCLERERLHYDCRKAARGAHSSAAIS